MPSKTKVVALTSLTAFTALTVKENYRLWQRNRSLRQAYATVIDANNILIDVGVNLNNALENQTQNTTYLLDKLAENDIELDEFDLIMLANNMPHE